jgi:hypothetical protein
MYYLLENDFTKTILKLENNFLISFIEDESNSEYQKYLEWLEEGNEPLPWPPQES